MIEPQTLWWKQARSDFDLFIVLRRRGASECHLLHYLQMATEKLSKAYLWRSGNPPPRVHTGFVRFIKALLSRRGELDRIAFVLGFNDQAGLVRWAGAVQPLAYSLQNIAPAEAMDGPNPEYPWPHYAPTACPVDHTFTLWNQLANTGQGRKLIDFIARATARFEQIA